MDHLAFQLALTWYWLMWPWLQHYIQHCLSILGYCTKDSLRTKYRPTHNRGHFDLWPLAVLQDCALKTADRPCATSKMANVYVTLTKWQWWTCCLWLSVFSLLRQLFLFSDSWHWSQPDKPVFIYHPPHYRLDTGYVFKKLLCSLRQCRIMDFIQVLNGIRCSPRVTVQFRFCCCWAWCYWSLHLWLVQWSKNIHKQVPGDMFDPKT